MRAGKIRPYVFYVIAFSLICSLASELKTALSMWSWGFSTWSISSISRIFFNLPGYVLIVVLQVVAAVVTIKALSLRKLFYLSCVFTIVDVLIVGLHRQMMEPAGSFFFPLFLIGQLLPYVAPIVILALIGRKKGVTELTENVGGGAVPSCVESEEATDSDTRGQLKALYEGYWYFFDILLVVVVYL